MRVFVHLRMSVCAHTLTVVSFRADKLRRGSLHMSAQMIVGLEGPKGGGRGDGRVGGWGWGGVLLGVHVNMCVECFADVEGTKNPVHTVTSWELVGTPSQ